MCYIIRHSPPGMPYGFVRILFFFLFFRRQGFRMMTFDRQAGPLQNLNRSQIMVIGRSISFSDPARPPVGGVGRPKNTPKSPPQKKKLCMRFRTPGTFLKKKFSRGKNFPGRWFCKKKIQLLKTSTTHPPPPPRPPPWNYYSSIKVPCTDQ